ncbi:unnamed protein product [Prunus armeniaca]|uniref:Reverse transcriptase domain-containing protein n=1 Tax=Prunus armeniaca TaxID=36596 RepID=A0A6J5W0I9_PRUAR|nr:unnamed protein product [Prunus armeniaca]
MSKPRREGDKIQSKGFWMTAAIGVWCTIFCDYFQGLFQTNGSGELSDIIEVVRPIVMLEQNASLNRPFSRDEIEGALSQMFPTKLSRVDGMPALFYQKYWDVVGNDVVAFCLNILKKEASVKEVNHTLLTLIPKVHMPTKSAFVPARLITDNIIAAFESIHAIKRQGGSKLKKMILKLDMSKASSGWRSYWYDYANKEFALGRPIVPLPVPDLC